MAYGNWGAFVYKNGDRRRDKEDVGVFDTDESCYDSGVRIFANIIKNREKFADGEEPWYVHSHHAVLGDGDVRLCGYKFWAELWVLDDGEIKQIPIPGECENEKVNGRVDVGCGTWHYTCDSYDDSMINLELVEPDGTIWKSTCGYCYGAGHME